MYCWWLAISFNFVDSYRTLSQRTTVLHQPIFAAGKNIERAKYNNDKDENFKQPAIQPMSEASRMVALASEERLQKVIARAGIASRRASENLVLCFAYYDNIV